MRRRSELMDKLRVKILQDWKNGLTYKEIERKRGVSSRTIANLVGGKDLKRFCQSCGQTDPGKLQEHHPDRANRPNETKTLCASCHEKITRKQQRERQRERKNNALIPEVVETTNPSMQRIMSAPPEVSYNNERPLTLEEQRWLGKGFCYGIGGIALGEGAFDKKIPMWIRGLLVIGGILFLYGGSTIGGNTENTDR